LILEKNYRNRFGEIDVIAKKNRSLIFVEVKTRTNLNYGNPLEAVNKLKISRIRKIASLYILKNKLSSFNPDFYVLSIIIKNSLVIEELKEEKNLLKIISSGILNDNKIVKIECIKNAF